MDDEKVWNAYNTMSCSPDLDRTRKLLARSELFRYTLEVPGDIVECGVFKGTGFMQWLKFVSIFSPGSVKRVVGFDTFDACPEIAKTETRLAELFSDSNLQKVPPVDVISSMAQLLAGSKGAYELVDGDVVFTAPDYVSRNPGFRISLLNLDMDVAEPTLAALKAFYPVVTRGGVIVFDEYAIPKWSESDAITEFFADKKEKLKCIGWAKSPTAYCIKE